MKIYKFVTAALIICTFLSCNDRNVITANNLPHQMYDSVKFYKDVDWITFNGLGISHNRPFTKYPHTEFGYKGDTIDILVHISENKRAKVQLRTFINGHKYYSSREYGDGRYTTFYYVFDETNSKKVCFWGDGKIDTGFNGNIREVEYYSKQGGNYKVEIYNGKFNSVIIPWQKIITKDSVFLEKNFCYYMMYIEEFKPPTFSTIFEHNITFCNTTNTNVVDTTKNIISSNVAPPSIFYFKALGGNGFEQLH
jgi:hypothetical protein